VQNWPHILSKNNASHRIKTKIETSCPCHIILYRYLIILCFKGIVEFLYSLQIMRYLIILCFEGIVEFLYYLHIQGQGYGA
jgi:hypothetical protein